MGFIFNAGALGLTDESINFGSDTIRARLVLSSASPSRTATSMTGIGITGNDQTLGSKTGPVKNDTDHRTEYDAADPTFTAQPAGDPVDKMVIFKFVTDDAGSTPIALVDIAEVIPQDNDITVQFDAAGAFYLDQDPA